MGIANQGKTPGRTTLLDAVSICLEAIGEAPVSLTTLGAEEIHEARLAERMILEVHKETQTRGWEFNTEYQFPFRKDAASKEITVPANVVRWTPCHEMVGRDLQLRGQRVYDRVERTYKFPDTVEEVHADVVWLLPWDDCPEPFNRYVLMRAGRMFSARTLGDSNTVQFNAMDEQVALNDLMLMEAENEKYNILTSGPGLRPFPTYTPGLGLARRYAGGGLRLG